MTEDRTFTLHNTGGSVVSGSASVESPFLIVSGSPYSLAGGANQTLTVRYSPTAEGSHNRDVTFTGGGGATRPVSGSAYIAPTISVTPASQDFGSIEVGTTADRAFTVQNDGGDSLLGSASVLPPYSIVSGETYNLGAGASQVVTVRYSPTGEGTHNHVVTFTGGGGAVRSVTGSAFVGNNELTITPGSRNHTHNSQIGQTVGVTANVSWTASRGSDSWITITGGSSGSGNGIVTYSITANTGAARSGVISVSGGGFTREFTVNQAGATQITVAPVASSVNTDIDIPIMIDNANGVLGFSVTLDYPASMAVYVSATAGSLTAGWSIVPNGTTTGRVVIVGAGTTALSGSGSLCVVRLHTSTSAGSGTMSLSPVQLNDGAIPCQGSSDVSFVTTSQFLWGNVNGDTVVGTLDASEILKSVAGLPSVIVTRTPPNPPSGDVDGNGTIGTLDASYILQKVAGIIPPTGFPADTNHDTYGPESEVLALAMNAAMAMPLAHELARQITVTPISPPPNAYIDIPVLIDDANGVQGFAVTLNYPAALADYVSVTAGSLTAGWAIVPNGTTDGRVVIAAAGTTALSGSGSLCVVRLHTASTTGSGTLSLNPVELNDGGLTAEGSSGVAWGTPPLPILAVTPVSRSVTNDAGSTTFSVANTGSGTLVWTAVVTSGGSWARITAGSSGSNAGTVTVGYDANPVGGAARSAAIRVTAPGATGSPIDVTVTQSANVALQVQVAVYGQTAGFVIANHPEFVENFRIDNWNGAAFDANVGRFTAPEIDVICVGGDTEFSSATALAIETAVRDDGKILLVNFWSNRNFGDSLPGTNGGSALEGTTMTVVDTTSPIFAGLPTVFNRQHGTDFNRESIAPKTGATVLMKYADNSPALLYWRYGNGWVIQWASEQMGGFFTGSQLDTINHRLLTMLLSEAHITLGESVNAPSLTWTTGGHANWFSQSQTTRDGLAAQSGAITHNQQSWMQTTVTGPGTISFWWKVSSEASWDFMRFYVGSSEMQKISGNVEWQQVSFAVPSGTYALKWQYDKDEIDLDTIGSDCGWVDQVAWVGTTVPAIPGNVQATQNLTQQIRVTWNAADRATSYEVWRRASTAATATRIATPTATSYSDVGATPGVTYYYWVRGRNNAGVGSYGTRAAGRCLPITSPGGVVATQNWTTQIRVTWGAVNGATSYEVWRRASNAATATRIATTASTSFSDVGAAVEVKYYYWVRGRNSAGVGSFSVRVTGRRVTILLRNRQSYGTMGGAQGSMRFFRVLVPSGQSRMVVQTWGGSGDADLYVRYGSLPTTSSYNGRSMRVGNADSVTINNPASGNWYIMVRGYGAYSGAYIKATH